MTTPTTIVRFECGCIGTVPDAKGMTAILSACEGDGGPGAPSRGMHGKQFESIDCTSDVWHAFDDAYKYRQLRQVMRSILHEEKS